MADEITVRFACGCQAVLGSAEHDPCCAVHGEHRISRVNAPPPRLRGIDCNPAKSLGPLEVT